MTLADVDVGQTAVIAGHDLSRSQLKCKLLALGLTKGVQVSVVNVAPFGDPIEIRLRGYSLSIRKNEAQHIKVKML